jgi:hypothetical protein
MGIAIRHMYLKWSGATQGNFSNIYPAPRLYYVTIFGVRRFLRRFEVEVCILQKIIFAVILMFSGKRGRDARGPRGKTPQTIT